MEVKEERLLEHYKANKDKNFKSLNEVAVSYFKSVWVPLEIAPKDRILNPALQSLLSN